MSTENILEILARKNMEVLRKELVANDVMDDALKIADGWREMGLFMTGGGTNISGNFARVGQGGRTAGR